MGHLFEKRKICHGCQGNYHSERKKGGGGVEGCGRKEKKEVQQLLWTELDFGGILSLQDKQQRGLFSLFSLFLFLSSHPSSCHPPSLSLFIISHSTFPISHCLSVCLSLSALFLLAPSHSPPLSLFPFLPPRFSLFLYPSCCSIIRNIIVKSASN